MPSMQEIRQKYPQYNDMPDEALAAALHSKYYSDMPRAEFDNKIGFSTIDEPQAEQGFTERLGSRLQERAAAVTSAKDLPNYLISSARLGIGGFGDVGMEAIKSIPGAQAVGEYIGQGISAITPEPIKQYAAGVAGKIPEFQEEHPLFSNLMGMAIDIGAAAGTAQGIQLAKRGAVGVGGTMLPKPPMPVTGAPGKKPMVSAKTAKGIGQDIYRGAEEYGGSFNQNFNNSLATRLDNFIETDPYAGSGAKNVNKFIEEKKSILKSGEPFSLKSYDLIDKDLGDKAFATMDIYGTMSNEGRTYLALQRELRDRVLNPRPSDVSDPAAFQANKLAGSIYSKYFQLRDIEQAMTKAAQSDNPAQVFKTRISHIYNSGKKSLAYKNDPELLNLLEKGSKTGASVGLLRLISSRLNALAGYAVAGPAAGGITYAIGRGASAMAEKLQMAPINKLRNIIGERISAEGLEAQNLLKGNGRYSQPIPPASPITQPTPLALPAPTMLGTQGGRPGTAAGFEQMGLTPGNLAAQREAAAVSAARQGALPSEQLALPSPQTVSKYPGETALRRQRIAESDARIAKEVDALKRATINSDKRTRGMQPRASELSPVLKMGQDGKYDPLPPSRQLESPEMHSRREYINKAIEKHNKLIEQDKAKAALGGESAPYNVITPQAPLTGQNIAARMKPSKKGKKK